MTPAFRLVMDGADITAKINTRLLSLTVTDEAGNKSDKCDIELDDCDPPVSLPNKGARLEVFLGYVDDLIRIGSYKVDEVEVGGSASGRTMTIRATAADMSGALKGSRTEAYHDTTLGSIVNSVASRNKLSPVVEAELASRAIPHVDQSNQSDMHFLTRLAVDHGAVFKVVDGKCIFAPSGRTSAASGKTINVVEVPYGADILTWRVVIQSRGEYTAVAARYHDYDLGSLATWTDGEATADQPTRTLTQRFPSQEAAKHATAAEKKRLKQKKTTLDLSVVGNARLAAEGMMNLTGFRAGVDGQWKIKTVTHSLTTSGFETTVQAGVPGDDDSKPAASGKSATNKSNGYNLGNLADWGEDLPLPPPAT